MWHRASGYFIPQEFVRTYCGGSKKRLLVRSSLASKTGCVCHFTANPLPACISIACTEQGCRIRHTGPVQRGHLGLLCPVAASRLQLSLQSARSYASERKAANGTQLPLSEFICKKQTCRYEQVKDLHKLLRPQDWLLSLDVSATYWHVPLHPATVHYLSFHLALPASYVNVSGRTVQVPLQPGAYWALPLGSAGQYQVVERTCENCRSDTPTHPLFGPRSSRSWLKP